ncbi:MAG: hypothetical protein O9327_02210 [Polaromonas sp.]|jgi:hypothetical protein|nr:hypothetical protein [Polaromonas sp.]
MDDCHDDEVNALQRLKHESIRAPRQSNPRELVYATRWLKLMSTSPRAARMLFLDYLAPVGQREASVVASVVTWFGTNIGQAFLEDAERRKTWVPTRQGCSDTLLRSEAYLAAWATENRRQLGINQGWRTLEAILTPEDAQRAKPSADDYEVVEHLMFWLGQLEGQQFIAECQAEVRALAEIQSLAAFERVGLTQSPRVRSLQAKIPAWVAAGEIAAHLAVSLACSGDPTLEARVG